MRLAPPDGDAVRLTVVGSGTLLPHALRGSAAHWVETTDARILLDCGAGTLHGLARWGLSWREVTHLLISHFHTDHVGEVAALLWALHHGPGIESGAPRSEPLTILGPAGTRSFLERLAAAHGGFVLDPGFPVTVAEPGEEGYPFPAAEESDPPVTADDGHPPTGGEGGLRFLRHPTPHTDRSIAWLVETSTGRLGYTGDTGPSESLGGFLAGADVVISECSVADSAGLDNHLSPTSAATLARGARPRLLLLTHLYPSLDPATLPDLLRQAGYDGWTITAWDGTVVEVDHGRVRLLRSGAGQGFESNAPTWTRTEQ